MSVVYGPVASWRLGRSLGVDPLAGNCKRCTFDCTYCQLGPTPPGPILRDAWVDPDILADELRATRHVPADYLTFSGLGEPTLASNLEELIRVARKLRNSPVAVLTNASLIVYPDVQRALSLADFVIAKVDAQDEEVFLQVNRPRIPCSAAGVIEGIRGFRAGYKGGLALQMMFVAANRSQAEPLAALARSICPDEVQLNTPLRPSPTPPLSPVRMAEIGRFFEGLPIRQVYGGPKGTAVTLDPAATRLRRPEAGIWTALDGGGMDCRREST
jgi:wyosine [tRNA(Phe)-imidazoG37] synthetase (radical SAM superfamily)